MTNMHRLLRIERAAEAIALDADQIGALDRPTAWAYICALEGLAGNTDTDPRWQRASEIREICEICGASFPWC